MSRNDRQQAVIAARRAAVEPLAIRRVSVRQIADLIGKQGYRQPQTEEPWAFQTIARDVKFLERQWQEQARTQHAEAKGRILAQYREVQRQAWLALSAAGMAPRDKAAIYKSILDACISESKLLGLDAPTKIDITHRLQAYAAEMGLDESAVLQEAEAVIRAIGR
jgi:hypothetical protein